MEQIDHEESKMIKSTHDIPKLFQDLLEGSMCQIVVSMDPIVKAPEYLHENEVVNFNLSWLFKAPLEIRDDGIAASLRFSGDWFDCWFPYAKIIGVVQQSTGDRWIFGCENISGENKRVALLIGDGSPGVIEGNKPEEEPVPFLRLVK